MITWKFYQLSDISTFRSELMGWAILWIMMLHFTFTQIKPIGFIAQYGFAGVEIFMFVSGFGLYYSLEKCHKLSYFYTRRLLRIFPTYYILGIFASILLYKDNIFTYLYRYTTIGFWTGDIYAEWYIPSIVFLYILAPFLKRLYEQKNYFIITSICIICIFVSYIYVTFNYFYKGEPHFFLLYRIPAFLFGMACAFWIKRDNSEIYYYYVLLAGIPIFILLFPRHHEIYNFKYFSLLFLLPIFTLSIVSISKLIRVINPCFSILGKASLEIYIIQGMFSHAILTGQIIIPMEYHDMLSILLIILSSLLGIIFHWLIGKTGITRIF